MAAGALKMWLLAALLLTALPAGAAPSVEWREPAGEAAELRICGLAAGEDGGLEVHAVAAGAAPAADLPPLWGEFSRGGDGCWSFRPRHRPAPGLELVVSSGGRILGRLALEPARAKTRVTGIAPGGEEIPANQLRLYVSFSGPMSLKGIESHVRLRRASGEEIAGAFVPVDGGLWDPGRRRLTLILHPGRVKSGIALGEELGPVLIEGEEVVVEVDAGARDADGAPLLAGASRRWRVGPPQRAALDAAAFRLTARDGKLVVEPPFPLDPALAPGALTLWRGGAPVDGEWSAGPDGRRLFFQPAEPWVRGASYRLRLGEQLEDGAGNRLGRAFEEEAGRHAEARAAEIEFRPLP